MNKTAQLIRNHLSGRITIASKQLFSKIESRLITAGFQPPFEFTIPEENKENLVYSIYSRLKSKSNLPNSLTNYQKMVLKQLGIDMEYKRYGVNFDYTNLIREVIEDNEKTISDIIDGEYIEEEVG